MNTSVMLRRLYLFFALCFLFNTVSCYLRYTEIYQLFTPKLWKKMLSEDHFHRQWRYATLPLFRPLPPNIAVQTNSFDFLDWQFNLFPAQLLLLDPQARNIPPDIQWVAVREGSSLPLQPLWQRIASTSDGFVLWEKKVKGGNP